MLHDIDNSLITWHWTLFRRTSVGASLALNLPEIKPMTHIYKESLSAKLSDTVLPYPALLCNNVCCTITDHICIFNKYANEIAAVRLGLGVF